MIALRDLGVVELVALSRDKPARGVALKRLGGALYGAKYIHDLKDMRDCKCASPPGRVMPEPCFQQDAEARFQHDPEPCFQQDRRRGGFALFRARR